MGAVGGVGLLSGCLGADVDVPRGLHEFLVGSNNYSGSIVGAMDSAAVSVGIGTDESGDYGLALRPAAVRITAGTMVVWIWGGGTHRVESIPDSSVQFESEQVNTGYGERGEYRFEQGFSDPGLVLYICTPHVGLGMKGAIDVVPDTERTPPPTD